MNTIELKEIVGYLPYGLKYFEIEYRKIHNIVGLIENEIWAKDDVGDAYSWNVSESDTMPILYPLVSAIEYREDLGFVPIEYNAFKHDKDSIIEFINNFAHAKSIKYGIIQRFYEWHIDIHNLIDRKFAIDATTLKL